MKVPPIIFLIDEDNINCSASKETAKFLQAAAQKIFFKLSFDLVKLDLLHNILWGLPVSYTLQNRKERKS